MLIITLPITCKTATSWRRSQCSVQTTHRKSNIRARNGLIGKIARNGSMYTANIVPTFYQKPCADMRNES